MKLLCHLLQNLKGQTTIITPNKSKCKRRYFAVRLVFIQGILVATRPFCSARVYVSRFLVISQIFLNFDVVLLDSWLLFLFSSFLIYILFLEYGFLQFWFLVYDHSSWSTWFLMEFFMIIILAADCGPVCWLVGFLRIRSKVCGLVRLRSAKGLGVGVITIRQRCW